MVVNIVMYLAVFLIFPFFVSRNHSIARATAYKPSKCEYVGFRTRSAVSAEQKLHSVKFLCCNHWFVVSLNPLSIPFIPAIIKWRGKNPVHFTKMQFPFWSFSGSWLRELPFIIHYFKNIWNSVIARKH